MTDKSSDTLRIEWSIEVLEDVKALGRDKPLGDKWPDLVMVIGTLKRVLEPNLSEHLAQPDGGFDRTVQRAWGRTSRR